MNKKILIKPVISEKSYNLASEGVYSFVVNSDATKIEIQKEIEKKFDVKVTKVRTVNIPGKRVRIGYTGKLARSRRKGRRSDTKKALITLKEGDKIALFDV